MVDWRLIALVLMFVGVTWFVRKRKDWVNPLLVAAALTTLVGTVMFLDVPLFR
ncbi:hypothetical protein [Actinosynnema sp. NPDC020468]|uniref:hypothetical protein n=1 Tax=Actinosynnema sp. NPDC020468 TaxID=3154488 RepID=UPI0033CFDC52